MPHGGLVGIGHHARMAPTFRPRHASGMLEPVIGRPGRILVVWMCVVAVTVLAPAAMASAHPHLAGGKTHFRAALPPDSGVNPPSSATTAGPGAAAAPAALTAAKFTVRRQRHHRHAATRGTAPDTHHRASTTTDGVSAVLDDMGPSLRASRARGRGAHHATISRTPGRRTAMAGVGDSGDCDTTTALVAMYSGLGGSHWYNRTGWDAAASVAAGDVDASSVSPCSWHGVSCFGSVVTKITLSNNNLVGSLTPAMLCVAPQVQVLDVVQNALVGALPVSVNPKAMLGLSIFNVADNQLSGHVPAWYALRQHAWLWLCGYGCVAVAVAVAVWLWCGFVALAWLITPLACLAVSPVSLVDAAQAVPTLTPHLCVAGGQPLHRPLPVVHDSAAEPHPPGCRQQ